MALIFFLVSLFSSCLGGFLTDLPQIPITADFVNSSLWVRDPEIVGGTRVPSAGKYPFMASLLSGGNLRCGASILSDTWLVTAAHCTPTSSMRITVGSLRYDGQGNPPAQSFPIRRSLTHPNYNSAAIDYDVALIELASPLTFSANVQPVKLAPTNSGDFTGDDSIIIGWGTTTEGGAISRDLLEVTIPIVSNADCNVAYGNITPRMVCAYEEDKDSCQGDSGGPAFTGTSTANYLQMGIVSWGYGCARQDYPGVYTRVSSVYSWVCQQTQAC